MRIGRRHWLVALAIALAAHGALLTRVKDMDTAAATAVGEGGVRIALAPRQGKPQPEQVAADAGEDNEPRAEKPAPPPQPAPQAESKPKSEPEPESKPEPVPAPQPEPTPVPRPKPEPQPTPKPQPEPEVKPKPQPKPRPRPQPTQPKPERTDRRASGATPADDKNRNDAAARASQTARQTQQGATGSVSDTPPDYRSKLGAWLAKHKNYPRRARRLRQEGTAVLYFVMDRNGHVLEWEIRESSGHPLLDAAVEQMIKDADPLPPLPESVAMQRLALTVPVRFRLR